MKPTRSILDPAFKWIPACQTDLRARFAQMAAQAKKEKPKPEPKTQGPIDIQRRKTA